MTPVAQEIACVGLKGRVESTRVRLISVIALGLCLGGWTGTHAADLATNATPGAPVASSNVETVISAYLVNFLRYVEWPQSVPPAGEPWRIGLLKARDLRGILDRMTAGKTIRGRPVVVVEAESPAGLRDCQLVLLTAPQDVDPGAFAGLPVLTVLYREESAASDGAVIELVLQGRNIRYRLNPELLAAQRLKPTPGLLENALRPAPAAGVRLP